MYEPKIVGFLCTWCSYTGADTAGIARLTTPSNFRAIRVPCSGRVSPEFVMRAFDQGADGVLVLGCHIGECHYDNGNHRTAKRLPALQSLLAYAGLEPERLRLDWVSSSEGERFARIVNEFTEAVRSLGPINWRVDGDWQSEVSGFSRKLFTKCAQMPISPIEFAESQYIEQIQRRAIELLASGTVGCVIGFEQGTHGRVRPAFIYEAEDCNRLIWNPDCTHNLTVYLPQKLKEKISGESDTGDTRVAVFVKPCDSRSINVLLTENRFKREQIYVIGFSCRGVREPNTKGFSLQRKCLDCDLERPVLYDESIGDAERDYQARRELQGQVDWDSSAQSIDKTLLSLTAQGRMEFWLSQFNRCIRCYACRQACPMCDCPTCLYERDDSLWVGMGIKVNEKRAFHLGRAYHLAGRCVGCDACEQVCPVGIPISLLNQHLANEIEQAYGHRAGMTLAPSPFVTILNGEEKSE